MTIKNIINKYNITKVDKKLIDELSLFKKELSSKNINKLESEFMKFKDQSINNTLTVMIVYAQYLPDQAIKLARKIGLFRYNAYGYDKNNAEYLINKMLLMEKEKIFNFSKDTTNYLNQKLNVSWLYDFYKTNENDLIKQIYSHHKTRYRLKMHSCNYEEALFKDLLVYLDILFNFYKPNPFYFNNNKNILLSYSNEEIAMAVSYLIYLYNNSIGIKQDINYIINSDYINSKKIESIVLKACKMIELQQWEILVDYYGYIIDTKDDKYYIHDNNTNIEKSIRIGYLKREMQSFVYYNEKIDSKIETLIDIGEKIQKVSKNKFIHKIHDGVMSRYIFKVPEEFYTAFAKNCKDSYFREELINMGFEAHEKMLNLNQILNQKITKDCTLKDVVLFQRLFRLIFVMYTSDICNRLKNKKKNRYIIFNSLTYVFTKSVLINLLSFFIGSSTKAEELLNFFTFDPKKSQRLDIQYTPFLHVSGGFVFSNTLVANSNLLRNSIAIANTYGNNITNGAYSEAIVDVCVDIFKKCSYHYDVYKNQKYKYKEKEGEIDVLAISNTSVIIIECKSPLNPTDNYEMRTIWDYVNKATEQLNKSSLAFSDNVFSSAFLNKLNIKEKKRQILTCIVMGNRIFNGYCTDAGHPIRYIYELDMILNKGRIYSEAGTWRVWQEEKFSSDDLINFLSPESKLFQIFFSSMIDANKSISVQINKYKKIINMQTYLLNQSKLINQCDKNFYIESQNQEFRDKIKKLQNDIDIGSPR